MLRKNISLSDAHLKQLDPLLKKHQGNLSAAMRDIIDFTGYVTANLGSLETAKDLLKEKNHARDVTLNRIYGVTIPLSIFRWLLADRKGSLPPLSDATQLFASYDINVHDVNGLNRILNEELSYLHWPVNVTAGIEDNMLSLQITGIDQELNRFSAILIAMFLASNKRSQKIKNVLSYPASIYMQFRDSENLEVAIQSIYENLSGNGKDRLSGQTEPLHVDVR